MPSTILGVWVYWWFNIGGSTLVVQPDLQNFDQVVGRNLLALFPDAVGTAHMLFGWCLLHSPDEAT